MTAEQPVTAPEPGPLADFHAAHSAVWGFVADSVPAVWQYGDVVAEHAALQPGGGGALVDRTWAGCLRLAGADRQRFLNGLLTCDVKDLAPGTTAYGFFTSREGHILADATLLALPEACHLEVPPGQEETVALHLEKYIIADRVEVERDTGLVAWSLVGDAAERRLAEVEEGTAAEEVVEDVPVVAVRRTLWGLPALTLWVDAGSAASLAERLLAGPDALRLVGFSALETSRVMSGIPRFFTELAGGCFPQESGLEAEAVSYTKGCYLGQEVVARIHFRGQANRQLCALHFSCDTPPDHGTQLMLEGRSVGAVGSAVRRLPGGGIVGLAVVHRRGAATGTRLQLEGDGEAEVVDLPLQP